MPDRRDVVVEQLDKLGTDLGALWRALTKDPKKEARKERLWTILTGILGAAAALGSRRAAARAWSVLTGEKPPTARQQQRKRPAA
jgi:hypothetical protein